MSLFRRETKINSGQGENRIEALLDQELLIMPGTSTKISWGDCVEGVLIMGSTGSGKSSGPGKHIAMAMLRQGFGFCILCGKNDERKRWEEYAQKAGRTNDLVIMNKTTGLKFNLLEYEMNREGEGAGDVLNIVNALMNLNEQNKVHLSAASGSEDRFWDNALRRLIARIASFLKLGGETLSILKMRIILSESFNSEDVKLYNHLVNISLTKEKIEATERKEAIDQLEAWRKRSLFLRLFEKIKTTEFATEEQQSEAQMVIDFWIKEFANLSERPRSIVLESLMGVIEPFLNPGILKSQFSEGVSEELVPSNIIKNKKIVIIDFPIKEFGISAIYASTLYKTAFQAALERRDITTEDDLKPISLWIDEYQNFCNPTNDTLFQLTARSSWVSSIFITQNLNNIYFVMGDKQPEARTKSLLGNLNLKIFASNSDSDTNQWASDMIGQHLSVIENLTVSPEGKKTKAFNQQLMPRILPDHFTTLRTGGLANKLKVDAVVFKPGKSWIYDDKVQNYDIVEFDQSD